MTSQRRPRRPAMLDPRDLEEIVGEEDLAQWSEVAHTTARVFVHLPGAEDDMDDATRAQVAEIVQGEEVEEIAELWARSPSSTLPGALWRLYLLRRWLHGEPQTVDQMLTAHARPAASDDSHDDAAGAAHARMAITKELDEIFDGNYDGDLVGTLRRAAALIRQAIGDAPAEGATMGARLAIQARELEEAATLAASGRLD